MSNSLQHHGLQHARFLCPSLFPGVCLNSCPLSQHSSSLHSAIRVVSFEVVISPATLLLFFFFFLQSGENVQPPAHLDQAALGAGDDHRCTSWLFLVVMPASPSLGSVVTHWELSYPLHCVHVPRPQSSSLEWLCIIWRGWGVLSASDEAGLVHSDRTVGVLTMVAVT